MISYVAGLARIALAVVGCQKKHSLSTGGDGSYRVFRLCAGVKFRVSVRLQEMSLEDEGFENGS